MLPPNLGEPDMRLKFIPESAIRVAKKKPATVQAAGR